jgi:hypothetical protein
LNFCFLPVKASDLDDLSPEKIDQRLPELKP